MSASAARAAVTAVVLLSTGSVRSQEAAPGPRADQQFDFMNLLTTHGLHELEDERWNAYGQLTLIDSWKPGFPAAYTNLNGSNSSLSPSPELSFTGTATLYLGLRLWKGAEVYFSPEVITEQPFSGLKGLGAAIQNFELQKGGTTTPQLYRAQAYLRQTIGLGGPATAQESQPLQLGTTYPTRRLVLELGNFSLLDFFDKSAFGIDGREGFFSLAFLTYGAYDFASDARGYSWGGVLELYWDDWALRFGRATPPQRPNGLPVEFRLYEYYGDQLELEHPYRIGGREGLVRLLGFRNREIMGRFDDAVATFEADHGKNAAACGNLASYGSANAGAPDLCWARKPNVKVGLGLFLQQWVAPDVGVFFRGMVADGQSEVDAYTSTDRSLSLGAIARGSLWRRPADVTGVAVNFGWISPAHAHYLRMGGVDGFIGDGFITPAAESVVDVFYSVGVLSSVWLAADYQHIVNPGFNADRGPVDVFGGRVHAEF